jgi:hypothetical protein
MPRLNAPRKVHGGVLTAAAKAAGFIEIASTPAINHDEIKKRRFSDD